MIETIVEEKCYIKGSIRNERELAIKIFVDGLNKKELKPSYHWIPKKSIKLKNKISPTRFIFRVDSWIFEKVKHAMMGKMIYQKEIKLENNEKSEVINSEISIPVLGEDGYTGCSYCDSEWLTKSDTDKVKFEHIQKNHPTYHKILLSESDNDLLDILKSLSTNNSKIYLNTILKLMTSKDGLSGFIVHCSNLKLRNLVRKALSNLNSKKELFKLKRIISDKFISDAISDRLRIL